MERYKSLFAENNSKTVQDILDSCNEFLKNKDKWNLRASTVSSFKNFLDNLNKLLEDPPLDPPFEVEKSKLIPQYTPIAKEKIPMWINTLLKKGEIGSYKKSNKTYLVNIKSPYLTPLTSKNIDVKKILNDIPDKKSEERVQLVKISASSVEFTISGTITTWQAISDRKGENISDFEEEEILSNMKEELLTNYRVQWVRDTLKNLFIPYNEKIKGYVGKPDEMRNGDYAKVVYFDLIISWK